MQTEPDCRSILSYCYVAAVSLFTDTYAGGSPDWAKGVARIKYSYTSELRPSHFLNYGFALPVDQALATGQEVFNGIKVIAEHLIQEAELLKTTGAPPPTSVTSQESANEGTCRSSDRFKRRYTMRHLSHPYT